jgi:hypothetical protein
VPDLIGKFEIIGEWASDGSLEESEDRVVLTVKELKDTIKKRVYELDLQILLAGLITILGIHQENGSKRFSLEVHVPLFLGRRWSTMWTCCIDERQRWSRCRTVVTT